MWSLWMWWLVGLTDFDWVLIVKWCMSVGGVQLWLKVGGAGWMVYWRCSSGYQRWVLLPAFRYGWFRYLLENG